jgi:hypothetical protein
MIILPFLVQELDTLNFDECLIAFHYTWNLVANPKSLHGLSFEVLKKRTENSLQTKLIISEHLKYLLQ